LRGDGASAQQTAVSTVVMMPSRLDRVPVETVVVAKSSVLACYYGTNQVRGDVVEGGPAFVDPVTLHAAQQHQRGARGRQVTIQRNQQNRRDNKAADHPECDASEPPQPSVGAICGPRGRKPPVSGASAQGQS